MKLNKTNKICIGVIILIVVIVVVLLVQNKDKLMRRNELVENFNSSEPSISNSNSNSNNLPSLDNIRAQLDKL